MSKGSGGKQPSLITASLLLLLACVFIFASCARDEAGGKTPGVSTPTPNAGTTPIATPTTAAGQPNGTTYGCPEELIMEKAPQADIIVKYENVNDTITAHTGDSIEIQLPFGRLWKGPEIKQGILEMQSPSGYAAKQDKMCVWRFVAKGPGTVDLDFLGRALCKEGALCPQYVISVPFTINVKN